MMLIKYKLLKTQWVLSVCNFFRESAQRIKVLKKYIINNLPGSRHKVLLSIRKTITLLIIITKVIVNNIIKH
jgi:hypothetical protein